MTQFRYTILFFCGFLAMSCQNNESSNSVSQTSNPSVQDLNNLDNATNADVTSVLSGGDLTAKDIKSADMTDAEKSAMEMFAYQDGEWVSEWAYFGEKGEIVRTVSGSITFSFLVDKYTQMLTNVIPSAQHTSYAMRSFSPAEQHVIFLNVGPDGDYWVMRKDPVTGLMVSAPHKNTDGTTVVQRYSDIVKNPDSMQVLMERSYDGGKTWAKGYVQTLTRKTYND